MPVDAPHDVAVAFPRVEQVADSPMEASNSSGLVLPAALPHVQVKTEDFPSIDGVELVSPRQAAPIKLGAQGTARVATSQQRTTR